jgi:malate/lactate dehydrogenase
VISQPLSLLCKVSPLIDELSLYDVVNTPGVTADLSHISSVAVSYSEIPLRLVILKACRKSPDTYQIMTD